MSEKLKESLNRLIRKILPSCKAVTVLVSKSLETKLLWHEHLILKYHLWLCVPCNRYLSHLKFIRRTFELQEDKLKRKNISKLSREASERLKEALKSSKSLLLFVLVNLL